MNQNNGLSTVINQKITNDREKRWAENAVHFAKNHQSIATIAGLHIVAAPEILYFLLHCKVRSNYITEEQRKSAREMGFRQQRRTERDIAEMGGYHPDEEHIFQAATAEKLATLGIFASRGVGVVERIYKKSAESLNYCARKRK